jgi:ribosomal protein L11 methyltransferase
VAAPTYLKRIYEVPAAGAELLVASLGEAGTLGIEELPGAAASSAADGVALQRLAAWFAADAAAPVSLPPGSRLLEERAIGAEDWMAGYRAAARPLAVGDRLLLDPREPLPRARRAAASRATRHRPPRRKDGRVRVRVPARSAFGTGSHASTRLALRLLERQPLSGRTVLDVGAGSGVLALAALALGARRAVGLDVDPAAALLAGQHARLNRLPAAFWAGGLGALGGGASFDLVLVNALPHEVLPEADGIAAAVGGQGRLVVSGVLASEASPTLVAWAARGLEPVDELSEEEWVAWTLGLR